MATAIFAQAIMLGQAKVSSESCSLASLGQWRRWSPWPPLRTRRARSLPYWQTSTWTWTSLTLLMQMATQAELEDVAVAVASLACAGASCSTGNVTSRTFSSRFGALWLLLRPLVALHGAGVRAGAYWFPHDPGGPSCSSCSLGLQRDLTWRVRNCGNETLALPSSSSSWWSSSVVGEWPPCA